MLTNALIVAALFWLLTDPAPPRDPDAPTLPATTTIGSPDQHDDPHERPPDARAASGLDEATWARVTEGEIVVRDERDGDRIVVTGAFLARGTPDAALDALTTYARIDQLYTDLEQVDVLRRGALHARVAYRAAYGPLRVSWAIDERWQPGALRWTLADVPGRPSTLRRCEGEWRLLAPADGLILFVYRNDIELPGVPDALLRRFAAGSVPAIAQRLRARLAEPRR